jgi:hypothetical protein
MTNFDWRAFLEKFSQELLADDEIRAAQPQEVVDSGWMGFDSASEAEITSLENRLGVSLPLSYRQFLRISNGWRHTGYFIYRLWSTSKVAWFEEHYQGWIDAYLEPSRGLPSISDDKYFVYGEEQDSVNIRVEYLETALEISDAGDSAIYLLNPKVVTSDGEWEAWFFANWLAGATRYRSFQELMEAERQKFLDMPKEEAN